MAYSQLLRVKMWTHLCDGSMPITKEDSCLGLKWCANEAGVPIVDGHTETQKVGASAEGTRKLRAQAEVVESGWDMWRQKSDKSYRGVSARRACSGFQD